MTEQAFDALVSHARTALDSAGQGVGTRAGEPPRYELFDGANSICSHKVRTVLAHHGLPYVSHAVDMFRGQTC